MKTNLFFLLLFFVACSRATNSADSTKNKKKSDTSEVEINNSDTISGELETPDTILKENKLLFAEGSVLLWPRKCFTDSTYNFSEIKQQVENYFNNNPIYSIGKNGIQKQTIQSGFCFQGECNGNQIAFHLSNAEEKGLICGSDFIKENDRFLVFNPIAGKTIPSADSAIFKPGGFKEVYQYADTDTNHIVQLGANGYMQENDWFLFDNIRWRLIRKENGKYQALKWQNISFSSTNLPKCFGAIIRKNSLVLIWYHSEGICCPQATQTWLTTIDFSDQQNIKYTSGKKYQSGIGQPCD